MIHKCWDKLFSEYLIILNNREEFYPKKDLVFKVFEMDVKDIRVVFLGQDPYHNPGQANGLSFSVNTNTKIPPSLNNIFKELKMEFPDRQYSFTSGNLEKWFYREKIFLLNCALTVPSHKATSHMDIWKDFTDKVIQFISEENDTCIFLLLGNFAKSKKQLINNPNRCVEGIHPSPIVQGFLGSNIFKKVEQILEEEIDWSL